MNCPVCSAPTSVVQSMRKTCPEKNLFIFRRRKCGNGHLSYSEEKFVGAPARSKDAAAPVAPASFSPVRGAAKIKITAESPDWLKRIADRI